MLKKILTIGILLLPFVYQAQSVQNGKVNIKPEKSVEISQAFDTFRKDLGISEGINFLSVNDRIFKSGMVHKKFKQTYKGLDVYKTFIILHCKDEKVNRITGNILTNIDINLNEKHKRTHRSLSLPVKYVQKKYNIKDEKLQQKFIDRVIIDKSYPNFSGQYTLAEKWIVTSEKLTRKYEVIIALPEGKVVFSQSLIRQGNADGIGKTFYYGNKMIKTDSISPNK